MLSRIKARMHRQAGGPRPTAPWDGKGLPGSEGWGSSSGGQAGCWEQGAGTGRAPFPPRALARGAGALPPTAISTLKTVPAAFLVLLCNQDSKNMLFCALQAFLSWGLVLRQPPQGSLGLLAAG